MRENELYRLLFERNPQPVWVYDLETLRFLAVNAAAVRQYGYTEAEFLRMTLRDIRPAGEMKRMEAALATLGPGPRDLGVWLHRRKDGSLLQVEISGDELHYDGRLARIAIIHDITDRVQAEEETRRLAERLEATLESLTDAFYTLDRDWRVTYINQAAEAVMGGRDQLLGKVLWEAFAPARGTIIEESYRKALAENVPVEFEVYYAPYDKRFEARAYPSAQGLAVTFRDISAEHRQREQLRVAEERFRLLSRATNDAVWDWDIQSDAMWWSDGFESMFGFARDEVETTVDSWTARIHPDDLDRVTISLHDVVDQGGNNWSDSYRFRRKHGGYVHVRDRGYVVRDDTGKPVRMVGGMTDLSSQRAAEERVLLQRSLLDAARDAIMLTDLDGRVLFWSKGAERVYGFTYAEATMGRDVEELLRPDKARYAEASRAVRDTGEWSGELRTCAKNDTALTVDARWTLLRDTRQEPDSILAIETDITERKKLEQLFLRAQRMESIGTLAGGIAHDLNNVLTPIMMSIELLKMDETDPEKLDILSTIETSTQQGSDMVRQVLSFARGVEGRRITLKPATLVRDIEKIVNETFLKNITVRTDIADDVWSIVGDPTQLHQVLLNLCVNARDAMPEGGTLAMSAENIRLDEHSVGLGPNATPGPHVCIAVEDSGTGMLPEVVERIFDPFFTTKEVGKGTGLGLSTSLGIVRSHGGFIRVYSEPGKGTTFRVFFPAQTGVQTAPEVAAVALLPRGNGELIMVVDDEASIRQITRQTLDAFGYRVVTAADSAEAITIYAERHHEIALVLTDMMMPVMDGAALIHVLRRMNPKLRVVAASGLDASGVVAKAANSGVKHFLPKPYPAEILLTTLADALKEPGPA
jgi:PAS domain S-box-containing protein